MAVLRGTLVSFAAGAYLASVRLDGSAPRTVDGVRVSRGIPAAELAAGRGVLVDTGEHGDPVDMVLYAVVA